jgi:PAS domain S-box-containing protein
MTCESERTAKESQRIRNTIAGELAFVAVYFLAGKFGLSLAFLNASASPIWPPTGIALAVLLLWGYKFGFGIFVGAFLVNITTQGSVATSLTIACGNTLEASVGAWLVSRFVGTPNLFTKPRNILRFMAWGAVVSTTLSPTFGVTSLCLGRVTPWNQYGASWLTWWLGDMVSDFTIAPLILIWVTEPLPHFARKQLFEAATLTLTLGLLDGLIFPGTFLFRDKSISLSYLALLPLFWAAFRFGQRGAITAAILTSGIALVGTLHGLGPFAKPDLNESLVLAQAFVATITLTALLVAAVVSDQRAVQAALRAKEGDLRLITDLTPVMLARCTRDLRYVFVNRAYASMVGRTPEQIAGTPIIEIMGRKGLETIRPHIEKVLQGQVVEYESEVTFEGIRDRYLRAVYKPDFDERGQIRGWIASIADITERKQADRARVLLSSIVESSDDAIISKDLDGNIITWNEAAERIFGYHAQEILGQHIFRIVPPELQQQENQILERLRRGEAIRQYETFRLAKNSSTIPVSLTISPLKDTTGRIVGASSIVRDITKSKQAEQALEKAKADLQAHAENLEKTVAERTAQLRETNAELEAFSFSLSHDLRAPLRTIRNFAQIVLDERRADLGPNAAFLERVVNAAKRMDRLIQDVLAFSRISRQSLTSHTVDVENLVLTITNERLDLQPPRAEIQIPSPLPPIRGDEASLSQCVANLLDNAVKFVPAGIMPRVVIRSEPVGEKVRLWFEDNGIGIDPGSQQTIFDMFQRAHPGGHYEGSGLGLAIVRKAVERMGGTVGVQSALGQGSRFWLELPRA